MPERPLLEGGALIPLRKMGGIDANRQKDWGMRDLAELARGNSALRGPISNNNNVIAFRSRP